MRGKPRKSCEIPHAIWRQRSHHTISAGLLHRLTISKRKPNKPTLSPLSKGNIPNRNRQHIASCATDPTPDPRTRGSRNDSETSWMGERRLVQPVPCQCPTLVTARFAPTSSSTARCCEGARTSEITTLSVADLVIFINNKDGSIPHTCLRTGWRNLERYS